MFFSLVFYNISPILYQSPINEKRIVENLFSELSTLFGKSTCFRHASQRHTRPKHGKILARTDLDLAFQLKAESQEFGDLVQGNFLDTYRFS